MGKIVVIDEDDLRKIIKDVMTENLQGSTNSVIDNNKQQDELLTSLEEIAKLFNCSQPTAQKIKNSIPKDKYRQCGKTFAIPKSVLLNGNVELNKTKYLRYK